MNTRYMEFFIKTVDCGSINAASQELYISPQGLSQALQQVEKELGEKMFFRQGNRLHLTAAGKAAYEAFEKIVEINDELTEQISKVRTTERSKQRHISLAVTPAMSVTCLPKVLTQFRQRHPDALIKIKEAQPEQLFQEIEFDENMVALLAIPATPRSRFFANIPEDVQFTCLLTCQQEVCMSVRSPMAEKKFMTAEDMERGKIVAFGGDSRFLNHVDSASDQEKIVVESRNMVLCRSIIASDKNTCGFTNLVVENYLKTPKLTSVPFKPSVSIEYGYAVKVCESGGKRNSLVEEFIDILVNELDQLK